MNKAETIQVITLVASNFDSIAKKDKIQKELMIATWHECLGDLDYQVVLQAVKKSMIDRPYLPTIHDIRENAVEMLNPQTQKTAIEAWNEAYKMICNGVYMTKKEFEQYTPEVKKFFGNVDQLKAYAMNTDFNMDVVRSNFLKQYEVILQRKKTQKMLPQQMKNFIEDFANRMDIKQMGGIND